MEEARAYNSHLIHKHGASSVHDLKEKGLIDISKIVSSEDIHKVHELR